MKFSTNKTQDKGSEEEPAYDHLAPPVKQLPEKEEARNIDNHEECSVTEDIGPPEQVAMNV